MLQLTRWGRGGELDCGGGGRRVHDGDVPDQRLGARVVGDLASLGRLRNGNRRASEATQGEGVGRMGGEGAGVWREAVWKEWGVAAGLRARRRRQRDASPTVFYNLHPDTNHGPRPDSLRADTDQSIPHPALPWPYPKCDCNSNLHPALSRPYPFTRLRARRRRHRDQNAQVAV